MRIDIEKPVVRRSSEGVRYHSCLNQLFDRQRADPFPGLSRGRLERGKAASSAIGQFPQQYRKRRPLKHYRKRLGEPAYGRSYNQGVLDPGILEKYLEEPRRNDRHVDRKKDRKPSLGRRERGADAAQRSKRNACICGIRNHGTECCQIAPCTSNLGSQAGGMQNFDRMTDERLTCKFLKCFIRSHP